MNKCSKQLCLIVDKASHLAEGLGLSTHLTPVDPMLEPRELARCGSHLHNILAGARLRIEPDTWQAIRLGQTSAEQIWRNLDDALPEIGELLS